MPKSRKSRPSDHHFVYVVYLHARNQRGWRGTPSTLILIAGFGATLFTFFGNYFLGGLHTYSGL